MERRVFIGTLAGGLLTTPFVVEAQQSARPARIGVLAATPLTQALQGAIRDGLREGLTRDFLNRWLTDDTYA